MTYANLEKKREKQRIYSKRWRAHHPEWKEKKRECDRKYRRAYTASHPEETKRDRQKWRDNNRNHLRNYGKQQRRTVKAEMIAAYGGHCVCCGDSTFEFLTLDHINGNGQEERKRHGNGYGLYAWLRKQGWPKKDYRLLCLNCNFSIGHYGYCPHRVTPFLGYSPHRFLAKTDSQPLAAELSEV